MDETTRAEQRLKALVCEKGLLANRYAARFDLAPDRFGPRLAAEQLEDSQPVSITFVPAPRGRTYILLSKLRSLSQFRHKKVAEVLQYGSCPGGIFIVQAETPARTVASVDRTQWALRHIVPVASQVLAPLAELLPSQRRALLPGGSMRERRRDSTLIPAASMIDARGVVCSRRRGAFGLRHLFAMARDARRRRSRSVDLVTRRRRFIDPAVGHFMQTR